MPKKTTKKTTDKYEYLQQLTNKMLIQMKGLKAKYDKMEPAKKKKLLTTIAGATALLVGVAAIKKMRKKK